jgi:hypothetical protein
LASKNARNNVTAPFIGVAIVLLLCIVAWMGYQNLFAPPKPYPKSPEVQQRENGWDALAKKSHGRIENLTPEEQDKLMKETGGHGAQIIANMAKQHGY